MAKVWVKGHTRSDGTKVKGHYREVSGRYYDRTRQEHFVNRIRLGETPNQAEKRINIQVDRRRWAKGGALPASSPSTRKKAYGRGIAKGWTSLPRI